jgi:hypothetical protein
VVIKVSGSIGPDKLKRRDLFRLWKSRVRDLVDLELEIRLQYSIVTGFQKTESLRARQVWLLEQSQTRQKHRVS